MPAETVIFDDTYFRDPHGFYGQVRQSGPIHRFATPSGVHGWLVTSEDLVRTVLTDPRIGKGRDTMLGVTVADEERTEWRSTVLRHAAEWVVTHMLGSNPPDHARLRDAVARHFTPPAVTDLTPRIEALTRGLLDAISPKATADMVRALASPLPVSVICHITGIPVTVRRRLERSSAALSDVTVTTKQEQRRAAIDFASIILPRLAQRRLRPRDDVLSTLARQVTDGRLSLKEALSTMALLLIAGHETTANLIAGSLLALLRDPAEYARVREDPARLGSVVDETLRADPPKPVATLRQARTDIDLAGQRVRKGELLMASLLAGNFDVGRAAGHMAFGAGIHHCLGARLARTEATIALAQIVERYPNMRLAVPAESLRWRRSIFFRRLESLPVHLGAA